MACTERDVSRRFAWCLLVAVCLPLLPSPVMAQEVFVVTGRVIGSQSNEGIHNAVVTLEGQPPALTGPSGEFRFDGVEEGRYSIRVRAFGYESFSQSLEVQGPVTLSLALDIAPFMLDSLVVSPREVELTGRVSDPTREISLRGVEVRTSLGEESRTNGRGRFDVNAWEGLGLLLQVRAFGYMPIDTVLIPSGDESYEFHVEPDPLVERMIEVEIRRIEERAGGRRAIMFRPLNRDDLLRRGGLTLLELLRTEYGGRLRLGCVIIDERALTPSMADGMLRTMLVEDLERIEFLYRGRMLRVYTREFMRTMIGGGIELGHTTYVDMADPPFCT